MTDRGLKLPPEQEAIRAKCFHPTGTFVEFPNEEIEQSIPERFEKIVRLYPERVAVKANNNALTYDELNKAANRVAQAILARPGKGDETVAILFEHGVFIIAAILGILKAARIYVPLDPSLPDTRTAYMLEDSQAKLLLTNTQHLSRAHQLAQRGQDILNCDDIDAHNDSANLDLPISPDTGALLLYTSGSTGSPKGVLHNHRNVLVETRNYTNDVRICPEDRLSLCQSCSFANSIRNIYGALLNGATLFPYDLASEGFPSLAEWMRTNRITIFHTLATIIRQVLDTIAADATFPALRILRFGGESTNGEEVKYFQRHFSPNCVLMNVIGLTEAFTIRRYFVSQEWHLDDTKVPLGYGVPDKEVFLLDQTGEEVSVSQIGEIAVRSKHLALGYWRRPDLTQAAFLPDPYGGDERLYLTGDLGMMCPDGCLIHMGRKDFQVKIRGNRVEVTEIEAALLELDSIQAAVVHAQADDAGEQRLIAYVVPAKGKAPTKTGLRRALAPILPDYMIPSALVFLEALPLTPNGRVDRRALPVPAPTRPDLDTPFVAPRTPTEEVLAGIWTEILGLDQVGMHDNFFELGGHSLLAVRLFIQIEKTFSKTVPLTTLFQAPTVEQLASILSREEWSPSWSSIVPIQPIGSRAPFFCVHGAWGTVLFCVDLARHLDPDQPFYGLQSSGFEREQDPLTEVEAMAAQFIDEIRKVQPEGPYRLGGLCMGGVVAFEIAQQLQSQGEKVALLALLDTPRPVPVSFLRHRLKSLRRALYGHFVERFGYHRRNLLELGPNERLGYMMEKARIAKARIVSKLFSSNGRVHARPEDIYWAKVRQSNIRAQRSYEPKAYPGPITLFLPSELPDTSSPNRRMAWRELATGGMEVHLVPGDHNTMIKEPHARVLAEKLQNCLQKAQTTQRGPAPRLN